MVKKGVIPCLLDDTPLAIFLLNYVFCDFRTSYDAGLQHLLKALKEKIVDTPVSAPWKPSDFVREILRGQNAVLSSLSTGNLTQAKKMQGKLNSVVEAARRQNPKDLYILSLVGYHKKNEYMIRHWKEIQAGKSPKDALLNEAMETFFKALSIQPEDPSALNGIGSVFILRRDLDAAEFYVRRALERSKQEHIPYEAAEHDLKLIQRLKAMGGPKG
jgi:tetratricopeptide (TPR) repeat protein